MTAIKAENQQSIVNRQTGIRRLLNGEKLHETLAEIRAPGFAEYPDDQKERVLDELSTRFLEHCKDKGLHINENRKRKVMNLCRKYIYEVRLAENFHLFNFFSGDNDGVLKPVYFSSDFEKDASTFQTRKTQVYKSEWKDFLLKEARVEESLIEAREERNKISPEDWATLRPLDALTEEIEQCCIKPT